MERCIACLELNEDICSRISTMSSKWIDRNMQRIIEKHLWWWYLKPPPENNGLVPWICSYCWTELLSFHNFYCKVEEAHRYYQSSIYFKEHQQTTIIKGGEMDRTPAAEAVSVVERGIEENAFDVVEVKDEFCSSQNEWNNDEADDYDSHKKLIKQEKDIDENEEVAFDIVEIKDEVCFSSAEWDTNETAHASKIYKDTFVYDANVKEYENTFNCNEVQSEDDIPLVHKFNTIKLQKQGSNKVIREAKSKETNFKVKSSFDNFFKETGHKLECCICNTPLSNFRSLKAHYRNEHNTLGYAMCCDKKYFKRCLLVDHLRLHTDSNFLKCQLCTKRFESRRGLQMHLETHEDRETTYNCDNCSKSYFKLKLLERHKLSHIPEIEKKFSCSQCDKKFASEYLRRYHEDMTHDKKYAKICDICGKSFSRNSWFLGHMKLHAGDPKCTETCNVCGVQLASKNGLREHIKRHVEENQWEHKCPFCSKVSPNRNAHRMHIKYAHIMQRKHACYFCDKAFRRPLELKEHLSTHTGEALYTCPHCPRTFIANGNMYSHRKTVHRKEWEESRLKRFENNDCKTASTEDGNKQTSKGD